MAIPVRQRVGGAVALLVALAACSQPPPDLPEGPRAAPRWERTPVIFVPGINREVARLLRDSLQALLHLPAVNPVSSPSSQRAPRESPPSRLTLQIL